LTPNPPPFEPLVAPSNFLWGVSTAGYQVEGGFNGPGEPRNNWATWEGTRRAEATASCVDFWQRWSGDLDLAKALGVNAFRLGIEWARIEPSPTGGFDPAALDRYADILAGARSRGMEPVVTLQHFTHPEWLGTDPWLDRATPLRFARFAHDVAIALGHRLEARGEPPLRFWVTVNEPNNLCIATYYLRAFPSGPKRPRALALSRSLATIMTAHVHARRALRDAYETHAWPAPVVTYNAWASAVYATDRYLVDLLRPATRQHTTELARAFRKAIGPVGFIGRIADFFLTRAVQPAAFAPLVAELGRDEDALDVLGLDYYHPFLGDYLGWTGPKLQPWQWPSQAARMPRFLDAWVGPHRDRPLYILEHGVGTRPTSASSRRPRHRPDGLARDEAIRGALQAIDRSMESGLDIAGYFHWSLIDNYEWGSFAPRFGLHGIDHGDNARRLATDITGIDAAATYREEIRARQRGATL